MHCVVSSLKYQTLSWGVNAILAHLHSVTLFCSIDIDEVMLNGQKIHYVPKGESRKIGRPEGVIMYLSMQLYFKHN